MSALNQVTEYLQEKIKKTNINNPKANTGCRILKSYTKEIPDIDRLTIDAMQQLAGMFSKQGNGTKKGEATLTYASSAIGNKIAGTLKISLSWTQAVRLGDLIVEAFYNTGLVDLTYGKTRDSKHMIIAGPAWAKALASIPAKKLIVGTSLTKPETITKMEQEWQYEDEAIRSSAIIKGKTKADNFLIKENKCSVWLTAINKLQQQAWELDPRIIEAVKAYDLPRPETDDRDVLQSWESKVSDKDTIVRKAEELADKTFYQYISADYRGRLYYEESYLSFQGSDWARGMFRFAKKKAMTEEGKQWLAIHTANSFNMSFNKDEIPDFFEADYFSYLEEEGLESISLDKMTLEDRIRWTVEMMDQILVEDKINENAEKPVSFLACCLEWQDLNEHGEGYESGLPIPVDGSNNGWQHLGAISKDVQTGELVGLVPVGIQSDFYVQTAKKLYEITTDERRKSILDAMPMKHIRKGISKRGSMTRAYSAGAAKIGENMWLDCRTEGFHNKYGITEEDCYGFAADLIKAIDAVCPGPLQTMSYLQNLAQYEIGIHKKFLNGEEADKEWRALRKQLNTLWDEYNLNLAMIKKIHDKDSEAVTDWKNNNSDWIESLKEKQEELREDIAKFDSVLVEGNGSASLSWITPSGFPVEYEAFTVVPRKAVGRIEGYNKYNKACEVNHQGEETTDAPDIQKFACGISPNYIHSLDASHMASVIASWSGNFGAVHDSFSAHACDVEDLLVKIKSTFINMYDCDNYFDRIRYQLTCNTDNVEQPALGELQIQEVNNSDYFFA